MLHHGLACLVHSRWDQLRALHTQTGGSARPPLGGVSEPLLQIGMSTLMSFGMSGMSSGLTRVGTVSQAMGSPEDAHGIVMTSHMTVGYEVTCRCPDLHQGCPPPHRHEAPSSWSHPTYKVHRIKKATSQPITNPNYKSIKKYTVGWETGSRKKHVKDWHLSSVMLKFMKKKNNKGPTRRKKKKDKG